MLQASSFFPLEKVYSDESQAHKKEKEAFKALELDDQKGKRIE